MPLLESTTGITPSLINSDSCSETSNTSRTSSTSSGSSFTYVHIDNSMELPAMLRWGASVGQIFDENGRPRRGESDSPLRDTEDEEEPPERPSHRSSRRRRRRKVVRRRCHCHRRHEYGYDHDCRTARAHTIYDEPEFTRDFFLIIGFCFVLACLLLCAGRPVAVSWVER
ncbi:nudix family hydrolase [Moniliophthora roreri]|uniref:Uncharacterized protein n=1 Tax=Moniliophthora roreri TaxID=221103 RepID=A0A0W0FZN6_MONRR|nr:nudix family hydrolase [Moniliophthora roreri]